jgi:streptomycin 6-kinase
MENHTDARRWLEQLPDRVRECSAKWGLGLGMPYPHSSVSIVFPAIRHDGSSAVLKIQFPHRESEYEGEALRLWSGNGAVRLLDEDLEHHALLLEQCAPGMPLSTRAGEEALLVFIDLLPRLWITAGKPFTTLAEESATWMKELPTSWEKAGRPFEVALLDSALESLERLRETQGEQVLVHQDLHADNVLSAAREPWLVIDPKPLVGERAFSLASIIRSYELGHSRSSVLRRLNKLSAALGVNRERARLWALGQTLAWSFTDTEVLHGHVESARWLWEA